MAGSRSWIMMSNHALGMSYTCIVYRVCIRASCDIPMTARRAPQGHGIRAKLRVCGAVKEGSRTDLRTLI